MVATLISKDAIPRLHPATILSYMGRDERSPV